MHVEAEHQAQRIITLVVNRYGIEFKFAADAVAVAPVQNLSLEHNNGLTLAIGLDVLCHQG
ncbi:hypothetical protein FQZ97_859670 [compost metagenome]